MTETVDAPVTRSRYGAGPGELVESLRARLAATDQELADRYWARHNVEDLIEARTDFFDELLLEIWNHCIPEKSAQ